MLCALHPSMRPSWAESWRRLLKPGATLVCMVYPVDPSRPNEGPPWPLTPEVYTGLLEPLGARVACRAACVAEAGALPHQGLLAAWAGVMSTWLVNLGWATRNQPFEPTLQRAAGQSVVCL
jgi:hypothetical protein